MPPRSNPTARQARLGAELRKLREACGMSASEAGAHLGGGTAQISHIEAGRWGVSPERVRRLAHHYGSGHQALIDELCRMAGERGRGWWDEYRSALTQGFLDVSELEHHARAILLLQITYIPGIFQTADYARAVFSSASHRIPKDQVDVRVEHRTRRRVIYDRATPPSTTALVHEAALRIRYGSRSVQRDQLRFLAEVAEWPAVQLRIVPFDMDGLSGSIQSMLYAVGPFPELDTVQIDDAFCGRLVNSVSLLAMYRDMFAVLERKALDASSSRNLIYQAIQEM